MQKKQDHFTLWVISGVIGVLIRDIYDLIFNLLGILNKVIWNIGADIFIAPAEIHTYLGHILGLLADLVIGGSLGIGIGLLIKYTSPKNYILKGWGIGSIAWLLFFGILLHNLPHIEKAAPQDALTNIMSFIGHSIFGITTAWAYVKLSKLETFSN